MSHCVYKTTNQINGKFYIGVHDLNRSGNYLGSGKRLLQAIKKYGRENFKQKILASFEIKNEAFDAEAEIVTRDLVRDRMCYNMALGGKGGALRKGTNNSNEHNEKIRKALLQNTNALGHKKSDETRLKISIARQGMKFTEEHRLKLSSALIGNTRAKGTIRSEEYKLRSSELRKGRVCSEETKNKMKVSQKQRWAKRREVCVSI